jgi:hypothetical protein
MFCVSELNNMNQIGIHFNLKLNLINNSLIIKISIKSKSKILKIEKKILKQFIR